MRSNHVATIYLKGRGAQNQVVPTGPGRHVNFVGGAAKVLDARDMPRMLQLPDVQVEVESDYADQIPLWKSLCPQQRPAVADIVVVGEPLTQADAEPQRKLPKARPPKDAVASTKWTPPSTDELDALLA